MTLAAMVTEQLRKAILRGEYQLGQRLTEAELGIRFDVNSVTVREAFHALEGEGLIVTVPFCGRSVFRLTADEIIELTMQRASLEAQAAYLAAIRLDDQAAERIRRAVEVLKTERPR
ncbi:MAG: GntR family transcriptional regulator, partial [Acidobacteria bacterium]